MVLIADAVGVRKVGVGKAQFLHLLVHLCHAAFDGAAAEIFRQQVRAVVGAGHLGGIKGINQRHFFPFPQGDMAGVRARQRVDVLVGHGQLYVVPVSLGLFTGKAQRHHLGDGRRVQFFVHILLGQHKAGVSIHDAVGAGGAEGGPGRRSARQAHAKHKQHSAERRCQFFHLVFLRRKFF